MDLCVWPAAQLFNFYFVPPQLRVLYVSSVTFGWSTFLAYYKENMQRSASAASVNNTQMTQTQPISAVLKAEGAKYLASQVCCVPFIS